MSDGIVDERRTRDGLIFATGAYVLWGLIPLYFKLLAEVPTLEVLAHRVVWSVVLLILIVTARGDWQRVAATIRRPRVMLTLTVSTTLIALNWFTYIYAVSSGQVLQSSLGYFINPLMNVLLGVVVLRERLRRFQVAALVLAGAGVVNLALLGNSIPWIALILAFSFAVYALLRKTVDADGLLGLLVETLLLLPLCGGYIAYRQMTGTGALGQSSTLDLWLALSGVATTIPLLLFAAGARRLPMATLGFLQYLAPTLQFLLAVVIFREPFSGTQVVSFALIWAAVALYSVESVWAYRNRMAAARRPAGPVAKPISVSPAAEAKVSQPQLCPREAP